MMKGNFVWHGPAVVERLKGDSAERILRAALLLQAEMMRRLNVSAGPQRRRRARGRGSYTVYTTPSRPGEYLRKRTGHLQARILVEPTSPAAVAKGGKVRVGYGQSALYGAFWELKKAGRRKGLLDLVKEIRPQLVAALSG